jgi:hypothetical protein
LGVAAASSWFLALALGAADPAALRTAAEGDDVGALRTLLDGGAALEARDERDWTALHHAVIAGRAEAAGLLLERGADPNARGQFDLTPLHWAALKGRADLVKLLVRRGARLDARDLWGCAPMHLAGDAKVVAALADLGADVNPIDGRGMTPLHLARSEDVANALLERKGDVRVRSREGRTALEIQVADSLQEKGLLVITRRADRLRGDSGRMEILVRRLDHRPLPGLEWSFASKACTAVPGSPKFDLAPGEMVVVPVALTRAAGVGDGDQRLDATVKAGGVEIGRLELVVDTTREETPEDRGLIRLGTGSVRSAPGPWANVAFVAAPLLLVVLWLAGSRLRRARRASKGGEGQPT